MMHPKCKRVFKACLWIAALAWGAVLFLFSGQNGAESGSLSLMITEFVLRICPWLPFSLEQLHPILRKLAHFSFFGLEGLLLGLALMCSLPKKRIGAWLALIICGVIAVLNEYHQSFSPGRSCEVRDMIIDTAGAAMGILLGAIIIRIAKRASRRRNNVII